MLVTEAFAAIARVTLKSRGIPELPLVILPRHTELMPIEELRPLIQGVFRQHVAPQLADLRRARVGS